MAMRLQCSTVQVDLFSMMPTLIVWLYLEREGVQVNNWKMGRKVYNFIRPMTGDVIPLKCCLSECVY